MIKLLILLIAGGFLLAFADDQKVKDTEKELTQLLTEALQGQPPQPLHFRYYQRAYYQKDNTVWLRVAFPRAHFSPPMSGKSIGQVSVTKIPNRPRYRVAIAFKSGGFSSPNGDITYHGKTYADIGIKLDWESLEMEFGIKTNRMPYADTYFIAHGAVLWWNGVESSISGNAGNGMREVDEDGDIMGEEIPKDFAAYIINSWVFNSLHKDVTLNKRLEELFKVL